MKSSITKIEGCKLLQLEKYLWALNIATKYIKNVGNPHYIRLSATQIYELVSSLSVCMLICKNSRYVNMYLTKYIWPRNIFYLL